MHIIFFSAKKPIMRQGRANSTCSESTTLSTHEIENIVDRLRNQRHRGCTQRNYYAIWKLFNKFFIRLDRKPPTLGERLTLFVAYLIENKKQSGTVKSYVSAIRAVLQINNIKFQEDEFLLTSLTKACKLNNDTVKTHLPIRKGLLHILL